MLGGGALTDSLRPDTALISIVKKDIEVAWSVIPGSFSGSAFLLSAPARIAIIRYAGRCGFAVHQSTLVSITDATRPRGRAAGPSPIHLLDRLLQSTDSGLGHRIVRVKLAGLLELLERRRVHLPNDVDASQIETREVR